MAGAGTLGIHLRWLPRARIEIPFRDCRRATASRSANPATINVPSRLETNLTTAWHECRHLGTEPGASEPGSRCESPTAPPWPRVESAGCVRAPARVANQAHLPHRQEAGATEHRRAVTGKEPPPLHGKRDLTPYRPFPQARGGSNETSRCHHGQRALPLRAAMRPDPLPSVANHKTPPQARGGSNGTSRCRHWQRAPLSAPNRDLTPDGPSRQSHKTPSRGRGVGEHPIVVRCRAQGTIPASHPAKPRPDP